MNEEVIAILENFFSRYKSYRYKKRENILFGEKEPTNVYYIVKGVVRTIFLTKEGRELTNTLLGPHDLFPILWVLFDKMPQHTFQALTNIEVKCAPKEDYLALTQEDSRIFQYTVKRVINRLEGVASRFEATLLGSASERVINVLFFVANNLGKWENGFAVVDFTFTHQEVADMAGLSRETVTLEMDKLQKEGSVQKISRGLLISDKLFKRLL